MNTTSVDCRRVWSAEEVKTVGDFFIEYRDTEKETGVLHVMLPGEEPYPDAVPFRRGAAGGDRVWGFDGNEMKPTLMPSIHLVGHWHGHLQSGRLVSC